MMGIATILLASSALHGVAVARHSNPGETSLGDNIFAACGLALLASIGGCSVLLILHVIVTKNNQKSVKRRIRLGLGSERD